MVVAYHPQCPHCHSIVQEYKKFATKVKNDKAPLDVLAINVSKTEPQQEKAMKIEGYPTIRL